MTTNPFSLSFPVEMEPYIEYIRNFVRANSTILAVSGVTVASYLALKGPVKDYMYKDFFDGYTRGLKFIDPMMHDFRNDVKAYLKELEQAYNGKKVIRLVEIGIGPGSTLDYFKGKSIEIIGVEPNPYFVKMLEDKKKDFPYFDVLQGYSEDLSSIPNESIDVVVTSLTLCTVSDLPKTLKEIKRILRKGGRLYFYEHQACHESWRRYFTQLIYTPYWMATMDGCRLARPIHKAIRNAGFDMSNTRMEFGPMSNDLLKPLTIGYALKK